MQPKDDKYHFGIFTLFLSKQHMSFNQTGFLKKFSNVFELTISTYMIFTIGSYI
jgi:hypothetical protein